MGDLHVTGVTQLDGLATLLGGEQVVGPVPVSALSSVSTGGSPVGIYVQGRYAYIADGGDTVIYDVSDPSAPARIGSVSSSPHAIFASGRYAYIVETGSALLRTIDVSNPATPVIVGSVSVGGSPFGIYVQGRYAYVANGGTLHVVDIASPSAPSVAGSVATGGSALSVYVQGRYAYIANFGSGTLQIYDISSPSAPSSVGSVAASAGPIGIYVQGRYAYVANVSANTLQAFDVSNPTAPVSVGSVATSIGPATVYVQGRYAYVATTSGTAGKIDVVDVSNPASMAIVASVSVGSGYPDGIYVQGRYAYVANSSTGKLQTFYFGGAYIQQLEAGGAEFGTLSVMDNISATDCAFSGGLSVGESLFVGGNVAAANIGTAAALASDADGTLAANSDSRVATQKATKTYVDAVAAGLKWKAPVRVATTVAGTLASSFANGSTVDGVTLATGDRILIKDQAAGAENGLYVVAVSGSPARATDADSGTELVSAAVFVMSGTANADKAFVCTNDSITLGSTSVVFVGFASVVGALIASNNLSDLANASTSRTNLGLGNVDNTSDATKNSATSTLTNKTLTAPIADVIAGGTTTTSTLTLKPTTGAGTTGADIIFKIGNNGATEAMRVLNSGKVGIGTAAPSGFLHVRNGADPGASVPTSSGVLISGTSTNNRCMLTDGNKVFYFGITNSLNYAELSTFDYGGGTVPHLVLQANGANVKINGSATRGTTEGSGHLDIFDGTAPVGTLTNGVSLYSASGELRVMDSGGTSTLLSPHDDENFWVFDSEDTTTGDKMRIEVEKLLRFVNDYFGLDFVKGKITKTP